LLFVGLAPLGFDLQGHEVTMRGADGDARACWGNKATPGAHPHDATKATHHDPCAFGGLHHMLVLLTALHLLELRHHPAAQCGTLPKGEQTDLVARHMLGRHADHSFLLNGS